MPYHNNYRGGPRAPRQFGNRGNFSSNPPPQQMNSGDFRHYQPPTRPLYNPSAPRNTASHPRHRDHHQTLRLQDDYLHFVAAQASQIFISRQELETKEAFRKRIEGIARSVFTHSSDRTKSSGSHEIRLKCIGSLGNGFALPGCDLDLVLALPGDEQLTREISILYGRRLEKALLDAKIGARLLTNTRVPVLRICELPGPDLLERLRKAKDDRDHPENGDLLPIDIERLEAAQGYFADLGDTAIETPLPASPLKEAKQDDPLEFNDDCGILCDINFSNHVAVFNTKLLRTYSLFDARVTQLGLLVKSWAKNRKINTPYHGTLSSYGYILMVLHYLMNVARPPVIPNLVHLARVEDSWRENPTVDLFEGCDVRFVKDPQQLEDVRGQMSPNRDSIGSLFRGFIHYYGQNNGFHWTNDVISLRTPGGILKKQDKGWTSAKWADDNSHVRLRYLLCVEDPFEIEHNIARTVVHGGIVAIRDEFRRAVKVLDTISRTSNGWQWLDGDSISTEGLMEVNPILRDYVRQDMEVHRARAKQRRVEERQERDTKSPGWATSDSPRDGDSQSGRDGMFYESPSTSPDRRGEFCHRDRSRSELTRGVGTHQGPQRSPRGRQRRVKAESDDENGDEQSAIVRQENPQVAETVQVKNEADSRVGLAQDLSNAISANVEVETSYSNDGLAAVPRPEPWDLSANEGRWLEWRDNRIRRGLPWTVWAGLKKIVHEQHPFDPQRQPTDPTFGIWQPEKGFPPWPLNRHLPTIEVAPEAWADNPDSQPSTFLGRRRRLVAWDPRTQGGAWLLKRDRLLLKGKKLSELSFGEQRLNALFPYNPEMSGSEIDAKNDLLRRYCVKRIFLPDEDYHRLQQIIREQGSMVKEVDQPYHLTTGANTWEQPTNTEIEPIANEDIVLQQTMLEPHSDTESDATKLTSSADNEDGSEQSTPETNIEELQEAEQPRTEPADHASSPEGWSRNCRHQIDPDFVRAQRLTFFRSKTLTRTHTDSEAPPSSVADVQILMQTAGLITPLATEQWNDSAIALTPPPHNSIASQTFPPTTSPHSTSPTFVSIFNRALPPPKPTTSNAVPTNTCVSTSTALSTTPAVPLTLHPHNTPSSPQPRGENPDILPIPRQSNHQFDVRQLRDLDIISRGGNGCARRGEEFEMETSDFEHGGAGAMGATAWGTGSSAVQRLRGGAGAIAGQRPGVTSEMPGGGESGWIGGDELPFPAQDAAGGQGAMNWNEVLDDSWVDAPVWTGEMATRDLHASADGEDVHW